MYIITNGKIVTEDVILTDYDLFIKGQKIEKIFPSGQLNLDETIEVIDAEGGYITPGFLDIHSDYIEHMAAPRPTSLINFKISIRETEKELISHGITTMFHSLSLYKSWDFAHKPIRDPENVKKLIDLIDETHTSKHLIRHRFHARFEIDNLDEVDHLKKYIDEKKVHLVSFMDHTPGQGQFRDLEIYKKTVKGYQDMTDDQIERSIILHQNKEKLTIDGMKEIAELAWKNGIAVASHDDDSIEKLNLVQSFGTTISEFPITLEIAQKAKEMGFYTMAGAPNILLGGSHSGNLSAADAIRQNSIDILSSDYYPPSLLHAVFEMHHKHQMNLVDMIKLVTINPAKAVKMDDEIGSIKEGKKADLLIIESIDSNFPVITTIIVDGKMIQRTNYRI